MSGRLLFEMFLVVSVGLAAPATAQQGPNPSGLDIPRWVSLRANEVNMRTGPGARYPIDWVYQRRFLPVEVVAEFDNWRQVRDVEGTTGWVHQSMLSGRRTATVSVAKARVQLTREDGAPAAAFVETGVIVGLEECDGEWCRITIDNPQVAGWIPRAALWGVYAGENFDR